MSPRTILTSASRALQLFASMAGMICAVPVHVSAAEPVPVQMATDLALSPDGQTLAFVWNEDIWSVAISGGTATRLTFDSAKDTQPKYSPDGQQLAFVSDRTGSDQIYVMPASGGRPEQKTYHSEGYALADWYPDGQSVLALAQRDHFWRSAQRMVQVNLKQRQADKLLLDDYAKDVALSHDGTQVLFVREGERWWRKGYQGERAGQIWMLDLKTGEAKELLHEGVECLWPMWMPDASGFYFTKGDKQGFDLWSCKFPKRDKRPLKQKQLVGFDEDSVVKPCLSRDGSTIVFRHLFDVYRWRTDSTEAPQKIDITIASDIGQRDDRFTSTVARADEVTFTDDGLEIAFTAGGDLWLMDSELREPIQATKTDGHESDPLFATDGKSIYFTRAVDGQIDVWQIKPKAEDKFWWQQKEFVETQLTQTPESESDLQLSPDGKKLFFQKGRGDLAVMDLESKQTTVLVDGFNPLDYTVSPDGAWVAYASQDNDFNSEIWLMPVDQSQPPVNVSRHPDNDDHPLFSPDGKLLVFTGRRVADESDIYYVYLREEDDDKGSRDRKLEKALEAMKKRKPSDSKPGEPKAESKESKSKEEASQGKAGAAEGENKDDKKEAKSKDDSARPAIKIDLEKIHERVRRINLPDTYERDLLFSPDGKKLAFSAAIGGKSGWQSVEFPDKLEPKPMSTTVLSQARWPKAANGILGLNRGTPAKLEGEKTTDYAFSIQHERSRSGRMREGFAAAWRLMHEIWYDPAMGSKNWDAVRRKYQTAASHAPDERALAEIVELMLGELNGSHLGFTPGTSMVEPEPSGEPSGSSERSTKTTAHLGVRFDSAYPGPGLRVRDVLPGGPADMHQRRLKPGDLILAIDGKNVDPALDLTEVLNGPLERDIVLTVQVAKGDKPEENKPEGAVAAPQTITIRPISYRRARVLLYDHWLEHNRQLTEELSDGKLGYLHIRAMDTSSLIEFERQLYNVGYGCDGLVIDVRDNGGGSTTDHLLTALTQPRHAMTIPRGGSIGYPHDRMVYATWSKPIVVLCNQNSYSNAEIFSHAIKALGRGKLVGVQTAGGVVSTGSARVTDVGVLRAPFRGWFSIKDGQDLEMNGAVPDVVVWPKPGELPKGVDPQLEAAVALLRTEVAKVQPLPKPRYATER